MSRARGNAKNHFNHARISAIRRQLHIVQDRLMACGPVKISSPIINRNFFDSVTSDHGGQTEAERIFK